MYTGLRGLLTLPEETITSLGTFAAMQARATATRPALSTSWGDPPEGDADAAKIHEPAPLSRDISSLAFALETSPGLDVTKDFSSTVRAMSVGFHAPERVHAMTGMPDAAATCTHRFPVFPPAPNTTMGAGAGGSEPGSISTDARTTREGARERTVRRPERTGAPWEAAKDKDSAVVILRGSTLWLVAPESRDESLNRRVFPWLDVFEPEL